MENEIYFLNLYKFWIFVPRPQYQNFVECKWIYKVKEEQREDGTVGNTFKAELAAKRFS